jgi:hypothetical protein
MATKEKTGSTFVDEICSIPGGSRKCSRDRWAADPRPATKTLTEFNNSCIALRNPN